MLFGRLVVLLNLPKPPTHGEARLFDHDGEIRKTICQDFTVDANVQKYRKCR
jgi:hypothetical protein